MAQRTIRLFGDPVLRTSCDPVTRFDDILAGLVADLEETVTGPGRAGLAANQIGVSQRVFSYYVDGQVGHVVNPVIEALEGEQVEDEGCLSIPGLWYPAKRAMYARVRGTDRRGEAIVIEGEGVLARCLQHEADHLDGRLFIDRLVGNARRQAMRDVRAQFVG